MSSVIYIHSYIYGKMNGYFRFWRTKFMRLELRRARRFGHIATFCARFNLHSMRANLVVCYVIVTRLRHHQLTQNSTIIITIYQTIFIQSGRHTCTHGDKRYTIRPIRSLNVGLRWMVSSHEQALVYRGKSSLSWNEIMSWCFPLADDTSAHNNLIWLQLSTSII